MYLLGYSLDNLSLMALTIAVGFVVDDAIVMLENIYRHIEDGLRADRRPPLNGAGEIGFTILSISLSLVAVFIPLLLMGGIIGRLFREFAVTVAHDASPSRPSSSLTLTPMMASRFLRARRGRAPRPALSRCPSAAFDALLDGYARGLDLGAAPPLRHARCLLRHRRGYRRSCSSPSRRASSRSRTPA